MMWYLNDVVKSKGIEFRCLSLAWKFSVSIFLNKVLSLRLFSFWNSSVCRLVLLAAPPNPSAGFTRHSFSPDLSPSLLVLPSAWKILLLKVLVHFFSPVIFFSYRLSVCLWLLSFRQMAHFVPALFSVSAACEFLFPVHSTPMKQLLWTLRAGLYFFGICN